MDRKDLSFFLSFLTCICNYNCDYKDCKYCYSIHTVLSLHRIAFKELSLRAIQSSNKRTTVQTAFIKLHLFSHPQSFFLTFSLSLSFQNKGTLHVSRRSSSSSHQPFTNRNPWIPTRTRTGIHDPHTPHGTIPRINPRRRHRNLRHEDPGRYDP